MDIRIKHVQPLGDTNCLLYALANLEDSPRSYLSFSAIEWYQSIPPFTWEDIQNIILVASQQNISCRILACVPPEGSPLDAHHVFSKCAQEGLEHCGDSYRVTLLLVRRKEKLKLAYMQRNLHVICLIAGKDSIYVMDPRVPRVKKFSGDTLLDSARWIERTLDYKFYGVLELVLPHTGGDYAYTISEEQLKNIFIYE
jgi:hypothetical protein